RTANRRVRAWSRATGFPTQAASRATTRWRWRYARSRSTRPASSSIPAAESVRSAPCPSMVGRSQSRAGPGCSPSSCPRPPPPASRSVIDETGLASGALLYRMRLAPWETRTIDVMVPMSGNAALARRWWDADTLQDETAQMWRDKLDRVALRLPSLGQALADTLRTSLAHMLVSRSGPRLQP